MALSWDPARDPDGSVRRYAVYRNGVLLGQPATTGYLARSLAPSTPYRFTVVAIDGAGHRSPEGVLDTATQAPLPATGPAYAYLLASTSKSFEDLQRHYRQVAVVSPTYYQVTPSLSISGQDDPLVTGWARLRGIAVEPRVETQDPTTLHTLLTSAANRTSLIERISALVAQHGYDGINIDFEAGAATDRPLLTAFATQLSQTLHAQGATLTMAVSAKTGPGHDRARRLLRLPRAGRRLRPPVHDGLGLPLGGEPGRRDLGRHLGGADHRLHQDGAERLALHHRHAALRLRLAAGRQGDAARVGRHDRPAGIARRADAVGSVGQEPFFTYTDTAGVPHTAYYATAQSVQGRLGQARAAGLGVGLWRLGDEDQETWNIPSLNP